MVGGALLVKVLSIEKEILAFSSEKSLPGEWLISVIFVTLGV